MPDIVPNELNFETTILLSADNGPTTVGPRVRLDFPLLVSTSESRRVVNVITDVEYDFPPSCEEINSMALNGEAAAPNRVYRDWVMGLYREEPTAAQVDPGSAGGITDTVSPQLTIGNPNVIDHNVFVEIVGGGAAGVSNTPTVHGTNIIRKNLQYLGVGTIVPNSYVWLVMQHSRATTTAGTAIGTYGNGTNFTANAVRIGCRIKYVQTTIPLTEWVGLYFSQQQLSDS